MDPTAATSFTALANQNSTATTGLPSYLQPYFDRALNRAESAATEAYKPYTGQLTAGLSPLESQAGNSAAGMQLPGQFQSAGNIYNQAAQGLMSLSGFQPGTLTGRYNPTQFSSGYTAGTPTAGYNPTQFSSGYTAGTLTAGYNPTQFSSGYTAAPAADYNRFTGYQAGNIGSNYVAGQTTGGVFDGGAAQQYMSPYQQNVTDIAKREAERDFQKQQSQLRARAGAARAFGGSRATLLETENQRNQNQLLDDIQTKGLQSAFTNAQEMFERDRQARLSAFGANESARQAQAQLGLTGQQAQEQARRAAAELGLGALVQRERDRQAAATLGLDAQRLSDQSRQFGANNALERFRAQEQARQTQATLGLDAQRLGDQSRQFGANNALDRFRAQEQARQTQATLGLDAQRLSDQSRQFSDRSQIDRFQVRENARQGAADIGIRGMTGAANVAQGLGALGSTIGQESRENIGLQAELGKQQREQQQGGLDRQLQLFLDERGYPMEQSKVFSGILAALANDQRTKTNVGPELSGLDKLLGYGAQGASLLNLIGGNQGAGAGLGSIISGVSGGFNDFLNSDFGKGLTSSLGTLFGGATDAVGGLFDDLFGSSPTSGGFDFDFSNFA